MVDNSKVVIASSDIWRASPAGFAVHVSRNTGEPWQPANHLKVLNRKIVEVAAGRLKYLIVSMPPRHGKSELISKYTPPWYLGTFPDRNLILSSYETDFAAEWGFKSRELYNEWAPKLFNAKVDPDNAAKARWETMSSAGNRLGGGMRTAGVGGPITGKGANLFIIDDPIKNAEEANSETLRNKMWEWWLSTAKTRLEPNAGVILLMTRWHQNDIAGKIIKQLLEKNLGTFEIINFPALAEEDDVLGRAPGEALWPWRYPKHVLEAIRDGSTAYWWNAMYQGHPIPKGGKIFKRPWFRIVNAPLSRVTASMRYWDFAGTQEGGDWTTGCLMSATAEGQFCIEDMIRGQWDTKEVEAVVKQTADLDGRRVKVRAEQDPGQSGKAQIANYARLLAGYDFQGISKRQSKENSYGPLASQAEVGNIFLVTGPWVSPFLDEMETVPTGNDDQADAASGCFNQLAQMELDRDIVFV